MTELPDPAPDELDAGYLEMAAAITDEERAERRAMAARRHARRAALEAAEDDQP